MTGQFIFDPRPISQRQVFSPAVRLDTLDGATVVIVDNGKKHAGTLLENIVDQLQRTWRLSGVVQLGPPSPGYGGEHDDAVAAAQLATAAISAVGDCGSCSAGTLLDAVIFERLGIPAVPIVTRPFLSTVRALASLHGMRNYGIVAVDHPIATLHPSEIAERASEATPRIVAGLVSPLSRKS